MSGDEAPVPANYVYPAAEWLRIEVVEYYIAPAPVKTLHVGVRVSLRRAGDRGEPYWAKFKIYSGLVHGGEKIDTDNLPADPAQLNREIERASEWIARTIVAEILGP